MTPGEIAVICILGFFAIMTVIIQDKSMKYLFGESDDWYVMHRDDYSGGKKRHKKKIKE